MGVLKKDKTSGTDNEQCNVKDNEKGNFVILIISNRSPSFMQYICSKAARFRSDPRRDAQFWTWFLIRPYTKNNPQ